MWLKPLKIVLYCSILLVICACSYQYHTIRCVRTLTIPKADSDVITVTVNFTAYVAYIHNKSDVARTNNDAVSRVVKGDVDGALALLQTGITSNEPVVLNNYGVALILKGDFDTGYQYIYKAAMLQPDNPYFRKNYLYLYELKY